MGDADSANTRGNAADYFTVETTAYCVASSHTKQLRLTYEVRPLQDGLERWFLVAMEEL